MGNPLTKANNRARLKQMTRYTIDVAKEFSRKPFGRLRSDGDYSAEVFRDDRLLPALREYDRVIVDLSGSNLYGSSFLEEAFGGLTDTISRSELRLKLVVKHDLLPSIVEEVQMYIFRDEHI